MKPQIETKTIRANLRLYAELGKIPADMIHAIESALGLDYVEQQAKKAEKDKLRAFGNEIADVLEHYDAFITMPMGKWDIVANGFLMHLDGHTFDERTFRRLAIIKAAQDKADKRIREKAPNIDIKEARQIIAEENAKVNDFVKHNKLS